MDYGALLGARWLGIATGGTAPKDYRTEVGSRPFLGTVFGLKEHKQSAYPPRTRCNIEDSDGTIIIRVHGNPSPGSDLTDYLCDSLEKPVFRLFIDGLHGELPIYRVQQWLMSVKPATLNFAGPRESSVPGIEAWTREYVKELFK